MSHGNLKETRPKVNGSLKPIQRSDQTQCIWEGHSTCELRPPGNILQIGTFYIKTLRTLMNETRQLVGYVELWEKQREMHWTNNDSSSNSVNSVWFELKLTDRTSYTVHQHDVDDSTGGKLPPGIVISRTHLALEKPISLAPHARTTIQNLEHKFIIATK